MSRAFPGTVDKTPREGSLAETLGAADILPAGDLESGASANGGSSGKGINGGI